MIFNMSGGGGASLNFKIVGGTTEPSNPSENMIWVNTDTEITSWTFAANEPSPAVSGMVLIFISTTSMVEFNALKKNSIQVYPISAKQYVSGEWVAKTAKSYQGGKWVDWWSGELYTPGNEWTDITGGWSAYAISNAGYSGTGYTPTVTRGDASITIANDGQKTVGQFMCNKDVDLTNYTSIRFVIDAVTFVSGVSQMGLFVAERSSLPSFASRQDFTAAGTYSLDVDSLTGEYAVGFYMVSTNGNATSMTINTVDMD